MRLIWTKNHTIKFEGRNVIMSVEYRLSYNASKLLSF